MFDSVKSNKVSQNITDQIRNAIFEGRLKPGDKLPSERELVEKFKVSKATLREALRSLEVLGFLEIRKGVSGGAFVTEVDMTKGERLLYQFPSFSKIFPSKIFQKFAFSWNPISQKRLTLAITEEDLNRLEKLIKECEYVLKE